MQHSSLGSSTSISPLYLQAVVRPRGGNMKRQTVTAVMLTSLIDAFTVIVFFTLMNPVVTNDNVKLTKGMSLPLAKSSDQLLAGPVIRVEGESYFINDRPVTKDNLRQALVEFAPKTDEEKLSKALILQADKGAAFSGFNPVILAASQNGIQKFQFLVLPDGK